MSDSADISQAAEKLDQALQSLEQALNPMLANFSELKKVASESESFASDRSRLAQELDDAKAKEAHFQDLKAEFNRLAGETTAELDTVITKVKNVLERD